MTSEARRSSGVRHVVLRDVEWIRSEPRFTANVLRPHFEQLCRHWARYFAPEDIVGGFPARVESGTVNDPGNKKTCQVDAAIFGTGADDRETILAIGEAKWHETMGTGHQAGRGRLIRAGGHHRAAYPTDRQAFHPELVRFLISML